MHSLKDRVALVTGASSGIGAATALALAATGAAVTLVARRAEKLEETAEQIRSAGGRCEAVAADVTDAQSIRHAVELSNQNFGRLDILIAAAGRGVAAPFSQTLVSEYREMIDVNYLGVLNCSPSSTRPRPRSRRGDAPRGRSRCRS